MNGRSEKPKLNFIFTLAKISFPFRRKLLPGFIRNYVPSKGVMHIDARFGYKILPVGVEILEAKQSLDLASDKA